MLELFHQWITCCKYEKVERADCTRSKSSKVAVSSSGEYSDIREGAGTGNNADCLNCPALPDHKLLGVSVKLDTDYGHSGLMDWTMDCSQARTQPPLE